MASSIESYIDSKKEWAEALKLLREIFASTEFCETVKWGIPTYTLNNKNVVAFSAFKSYVGIWFFQGSFLTDSAKKLINAQEGVTRGQRQWRFKNPEEIRENRELILSYLEEAIQNQKDGFDALSKSKQREYCKYIAQAKREETRQKRLEKICPMIEEGVGLNDKYKK